jgi:hypothetical protein
VGRAHDLTTRLHAFLGAARLTYAQAGRALGVHPNSLRYAAATGTVLIRWEGPRHGVAAFQALRTSLTPVRAPVGEAWSLTRDQPTFRAAPGPAAPARLLPSGDAHLLLQGADHQLLVRTPNAVALWTPRVWPAGLLVEGEVVGTWR